MVDATLSGNTTTAELQARLHRPEAQPGTLTLVMLLIEDEHVTDQFEAAGLTVREQAAIVLHRRGLLSWEIARLMDTTEANARSRPGPRSGRGGAAGLTDAEIGAQLFLSRKTVSHHVSAALAQLDVKSRRAAGRLLSQARDRPGEPRG